MVYEEVQGSIFDYHKQGYHIVHCISADFRFGSDAGVYRELNKRFDLRLDLIYGFGSGWFREYDEKFPGDVLIHPPKHIIDLVTKTRYSNKSTLYAVIRSLKKLKIGCQRKHITKLVMPRGECGLDELKWEDVSKAIQNVFEDTDIEFVVCYQGGDSNGNE